MEGRCGLLFHISRKLLIVFQNVLVLIPVAGENIGDQRFRFRNCQVILVLPPGNPGKVRARMSVPFSFPKQSYRLVEERTMRSSNEETSCEISFICSLP